MHGKYLADAAGGLIKRYWDGLKRSFKGKQIVGDVISALLSAREAPQGAFSRRVSELLHFPFSIFSIFFLVAL